MVDFLKRSIERLEAPTCVHCNLTMAWLRSTRAAEGKEFINHFFQCSNCNGIQEVRARVRATGENVILPPRNISKPYLITSPASGEGGEPVKKLQEYLQHAAECRDMARTATATHRQQLE